MGQHKREYLLTREEYESFLETGRTQPFGGWKKEMLLNKTHVTVSMTYWKHVGDIIIKVHHPTLSPYIFKIPTEHGAPPYLEVIKAFQIGVRDIAWKLLDRYISIEAELARINV
jgi:hypothetical protein